MSQKISLKEAEQKVFRATYNDGLWDFLLGCYFLIFIIALYLSPIFGDFWSSTIFIPFIALVYLARWLVKKYVVAPRIGNVKFGPVRKGKLKIFTIILLIFNIAALALGVVAAMSIGMVPGQMFSIGLGMMLLIGFSIAAYTLGVNRLYIYGLLVGLSPVVGEWLWNQGYATHHGFPITFGILAAIMMLTGLILFVRFLRDNPLPIEDIPGEKA